MPELREEDRGPPALRRCAPRRLPELRRRGEEAHLLAGLPVQGDRLVRHRLRRQEGPRRQGLEVQGRQGRRGRRQGGKGREEREIREGGKARCSRRDEELELGVVQEILALFL